MAKYRIRLHGRKTFRKRSKRRKLQFRFVLPSRIRRLLRPAVGCVLLAVLIGFAVTMSVQAARIAEERDRANNEAAIAQQVSDFLVGLFEVSDPSEACDTQGLARIVRDSPRWSVWGRFRHSS